MKICHIKNNGSLSYDIEIEFNRRGWAKIITIFPAYSSEKLSFSNAALIRLMAISSTHHYHYIIISHGSSHEANFRPSTHLVTMVRRESYQRHITIGHHLLLNESETG